MRADLARRVLLLLALASALAGAPTVAYAEDEVDRCEMLLVEGKTREALACFRRLAEGPLGADPRVQAGLGFALFTLGEARAAVEPLRRAAATRGNPSDHVALAEALIGSAEERMKAGPALSIDVVPFLKDALAALDAAGDAADVAAPRAFLRGKAHWLLDDPAAARTALASPLLATDRRSADLRARIAYAAGDFASAAAEFEKSGNPHAAATAWYAAKDGRAVDAYVALLRANPGDEALLEEALGAARTTKRAGDLERALASIEPAASVRAAWLVARGRLADADGRPDDALARFREAAAADPEDPRPLVRQADLRWSRSPDDPVAVEEAVRALLDALTKAPDDRNARWVLEAIAAREAGGAAALWPDRTRLDRAIAVYEALVKADPGDADAFANLGNARRLAGEPEAAIAAYDRGVEANPHNPLVWNDRGLALLAAGRDDDALASFEKAASVDPSAISPRQNAARLLWLRGDYAAASRHLLAATRTARATTGSPMLYRFLLDRVERARARPDAR
jgi:tetratricopeptide (TPR) repeat protein